MVKSNNAKKTITQNHQDNNINRNLHKTQNKNTVARRVQEAFKFAIYIILVSMALGIFFAYLFIKFGNEVVYNVKNTVLHEKQIVNNYFGRLKNLKLFDWLKHKHNEEIAENTHLFDKNFRGPENVKSNSSQAFNYLPNNEPIVNVVKKVLPGVVSIAIDQSNILPGPTFINKNSKIGSGFVIDANKGIIVTNRHVVEESGKYTYKVVTSNGKTLQVLKILQDPVNDLAFVFVNAQAVKLHALQLGDSDHLELGQTVIAIGTPFGEFPSTVTSGIISGLHRKVDAPDMWGYNKTYFDVIQTDAAINPGNSGGPLINLAGQVIGINFAKISGGDNISFALPINLVKKRLEQYNKFGHFRQAFLGVSVRHLDYATASYYGVPAGDLVVNVVPGSPAYKAGIKARDIITKVDNYSLGDIGLISVLSRYNVGDKITLSIARPITRNGFNVSFKTIKIQVTLADRYKFLRR